jgi:alkylated DNA repair dioxygenase AlkB
MSGLCQKMWEHEVPRETRVTEPRINLTFRMVNNLQ